MMAASFLQSQKISSLDNIIMAEDYYSILGAQKGIQLTEELKLEMKRTYKKLAFKYHPDKNTACDVDAEEIFKVTEIAQKCPKLFAAGQLEQSIGGNFWCIQFST